MSADVTVVVPCKDAAPYLADALASIARQGESVAEVIVVDDGSADRSAELAADHGARVILAGGVGPAAARNLGAAATGTPWLAFLDADDVWTDASLATRREAAAGAGADLVVGAVATLDSPEESLGAARLPGAMLLTRDLWDRVGPLAEDRLGGYMLEWCDRLGRVPVTTAVTDEVVLLRRSHEDNLTRRHDMTADYLAWARTIAARRRAG